MKRVIFSVVALGASAMVFCSTASAERRCVGEKSEVKTAKTAVKTADKTRRSLGRQIAKVERKIKSTESKYNRKITGAEARATKYRQRMSQCNATASLITQFFRDDSTATEAMCNASNLSNSLFGWGSDPFAGIVGMIFGGCSSSTGGVLGGLLGGGSSSDAQCEAERARERARRQRCLNIANTACSRTVYYLAQKKGYEDTKRDELARLNSEKTRLTTEKATAETAYTRAVTALRAAETRYTQCMSAPRVTPTPTPTPSGSR